MIAPRVEDDSRSKIGACIDPSHARGEKSCCQGSVIRNFRCTLRLSLPLAGEQPLSVLQKVRFPLEPLTTTKTWPIPFPFCTRMALSWPVLEQPLSAFIYQFLPVQFIPRSLADCYNRDGNNFLPLLSSAKDVLVTRLKKCLFSIKIKEIRQNWDTLVNFGQFRKYTESMFLFLFFVK